MSDTMMALAWKAKGLPAEEKLLLLAIADEADSTGATMVGRLLLQRKLDWLGQEELTTKVWKSLETKGLLVEYDQFMRLVVSRLTNASAPPHTPPSSDLAVTRATKERPEKSKTKTSTKKDSTIAVPRRRNSIWDALAAAVGEPLTKSEASDFGKSVRELSEAKAQPEQIAGFKPWWEREFPGASCTHRCFRQHWSKYITAVAKRSSQSNVLDL